MTIKVAGAAACTLVEDVVASQPSTILTDATESAYYYAAAIPKGGELDLASTTPTFADGSRAAGVAFWCGYLQRPDEGKLRLYMGGVLVAESGLLGSSDSAVVTGTRALVGAQECKATLYNSNAEFTLFYRSYNRATGSPIAVGVGVGSIKVA